MAEGFLRRFRPSLQPTLKEYLLDIKYFPLQSVWVTEDDLAAIEITKLQIFSAYGKYEEFELPRGVDLRLKLEATGHVRLFCVIKAPSQWPISDNTHIKPLKYLIVAELCWHHDLNMNVAFKYKDFEESGSSEEKDEGVKNPSKFSKSEISFNIGSSGGFAMLGDYYPSGVRYYAARGCPDPVHDARVFVMRLQKQIQATLDKRHMKEEFKLSVPAEWPACYETKIKSTWIKISFNNPANKNDPGMSSLHDAIHGESLGNKFKPNSRGAGPLVSKSFPLFKSCAVWKDGWVLRTATINVKIESKRPEPPTPIYLEEETAPDDYSSPFDERVDTEATTRKAAEEAFHHHFSGSSKPKRYSGNFGDSDISADNLLIDLTSDGNGPRYITSPKPAQPSTSSKRDIFGDEEDHNSSQIFPPIKPTSQYPAIDNFRSLPMISNNNYDDMTTSDLEKRREDLEQAIATIKYRLFQLRLRRSMQMSSRSRKAQQADIPAFKWEI